LLLQMYKYTLEISHVFTYHIGMAQTMHRLEEKKIC